MLDRYVRQTDMSYTTMSFTATSYTQLSQICHTQLCHSQLCHEKLCQTDMSYTDMLASRASCFPNASQQSIWASQGRAAEGGITMVVRVVLVGIP